MREAGGPGGFVGRSDAIPEIHRDTGREWIGIGDHPQPVVEGSVVDRVVQAGDF